MKLFHFFTFQDNSYLGCALPQSGWGAPKQPATKPSGAWGLRSLQDAHKQSWQ